MNDLSVSAIGSVLVAPGGSTTFNVTYTAWEAGSWATAIRLGTNDELASTFDLPLSGTGLAPVLTLTPESADLGAIVVGCTTRFADELFLTVISNDPYTPASQASVSATGAYGEGCS